MSKFDKLLFISALVLFFAFYGILNVSIFLGLPNSLISGGIRSYILTVAIYLFLKDVVNRQYAVPDFYFISFILYFLYLSFVIFIDDWNKYNLGDGWAAMNGGKIFIFYNLFIANLGTFLIFLCGKNRFEFLSRNIMIAYIPLFISVVAITYLNRGAFQTMSLNSSDLGISRSLTKMPMLLLFITSLYFFIFEEKIWKKFAFGITGLGLAFTNLLFSDSRSSIITFAMLFLVFALISLRNVSHTMWTIFLAICGSVVMIPYIISSTAFERLAELIYFNQDYIAGNSSLSRIDLIRSGLSTFANAPLGGSIYIPGIGIFTHFFPVDVLMTTGFIGFVLLFVSYWGGVKGSLWLIRRDTKFVWVIGFAVMDILQQCFHGSSIDTVCYALAIMFSAYSLKCLSMPPQFR